MSASYDRAKVDEEIRTILALNKAVSLAIIEPLDGSGLLF